MTLAHDPRIYTKCMEEIKRRVEIIDVEGRPWRKHKAISVANCELAGLQLRKVLELIVFASLAANKEGYVKLRQRFEKDWNMSAIVKVLRKINPDFFPVPIEEKESKEEGIRAEIVEAKSEKISIEDAIKMHGSVGELMHSRNPYRKDLDYGKLLKEIRRSRDRIVRLLDKHRVTVRPGQVFYRVAMRTGASNDVQCAVLEALSDTKDG